MRSGEKKKWWAKDNEIITVCRRWAQVIHDKHAITRSDWNRKLPTNWRIFIYFSQKLAVYEKNYYHERQHLIEQLTSHELKHNPRGRNNNTIKNVRTSLNCSGNYRWTKNCQSGKPFGENDLTVLTVICIHVHIRVINFLFFFTYYLIEIK